jgi:hypothetical protein
MYWTVHAAGCKVLEEEAKTYRIDPFDLTQSLAAQGLPADRNRPDERVRTALAAIK